MAADEIVGDLVEVHRRHSRTHALFEQLHRFRENLAAPGHDLDFALRLDLNHFPSALRARAVTSSTAASASILRTFILFSPYQSITGAVCRRYTSRRLRIASGSSSFLLTSFPPHFSHLLPGARPIYG